MLYILRRRLPQRINRRFKKAPMANKENSDDDEYYTKDDDDIGYGSDLWEEDDGVVRYESDLYVDNDHVAGYKLDSRVDGEDNTKGRYSILREEEIQKRQQADIVETASILALLSGATTSLLRCYNRVVVKV